jgi:hypothetical protein
LKQPKKKATNKKPQRSKKRVRGLSLKKAAKTVAKLLWVHLVKLPEEEREQGIAQIERALVKKLKKIRRKSGRKPKSRNA